MMKWKTIISLTPVLKRLICGHGFVGKNASISCALSTSQVCRYVIGTPCIYTFFSYIYTHTWIYTVRVSWFSSFTLPSPRHPRLTINARVPRDEWQTHRHGGACHCKFHQTVLHILIISAPDLYHRLLQQCVDKRSGFIYQCTRSLAAMLGPGCAVIGIDRTVWKLLLREESKSSPFIASLYYTPATKGQGENEREVRSRLDYHRSPHVCSSEKNLRIYRDFLSKLSSILPSRKSGKIIRHISFMISRGAPSSIVAKCLSPINVGMKLFPD